MKAKIVVFLAICILALGALSSQIYAKEGSDDSVGASSGSSSGNESSGSSGGQEAENRGGESENEQRGQEFEAERGGATEQKGQEAEAERGGVSETRGQEPEARGSVSENEMEQEIAGITFEIRGTISSVSSNTFTVLGRTVTIDPSRVFNFQETAPIAVGQSVKIEGSIDNGIFLAREIKPLVENNNGSSQNSGPGSVNSGRNQEHGIEVENESNVFEVRGEIEFVSGSTFRVFGQDVTIDPAKLISLQETEPVAVGQSVEVNGVIENGIFLAREIKPLVEANENELADDNSGPNNQKKEDKSIFASMENIFGSIVSFMRSIFR